jgi:2-polyprenyl-3-methyl-5-hydroxy-6-metoxy-1,4-benzoquinol methylase
VLDRAKARFPDAGIDWRHDDVLTASLEPGSFDAVVSNATLHHLRDTTIALRRLADLVRPGGALAVVGFARPDLRDLPWNAVTFVARGVALRVRGKWQHNAPTVWPPADTLRQLKHAATATLPGARVRQLILGRYLLTYTRLESQDPDPR